MSTTAVPPTPDLSFDFTDPDVNQSGIPYEEFAAARQTAPIHWVAQPPESKAGMAGPEGYWAITKHEHVLEISKNNKDFSTAVNSAIIRFAPEMQREQVELQRVMLINQDPPDHTKLRQIISRGFTPRSINGLHDDLKIRAERIVKECVERGAGDFVYDLAAELPLMAIADLLGVPLEDRRKLFEWSNSMLSYDDPEYDVDPETASIEILSYFMAMAEDRKANPRDDIVTKLVTADVDGHGLNSDEFGYFVIILSVAGNETTRNAITHGMHAFFQNPDQWELFKRERNEGAIDEIIRWATPVTVFQRTALNDVEVGGQLIKAGDRVGLFYASANFDTDVFEGPDKFDITRSPNPHLSFGGHGAHYCIGANLARMEVGLIFNAIADFAPDITQAGEPRRLRHAWINGIKEMQVRYK